MASPLLISFKPLDRQRRVFELLGILWMLSLADLCFTLWAQRFTAFHELNPIARQLLGHGANASLICYKLSLMTFASCIFWHVRRHGRAELALWGLVIVHVLLAFQWSHYTRGAIALAMQ